MSYTACTQQSAQYPYYHVIKKSLKIFMRCWILNISPTLLPCL